MGWPYQFLDLDHEQKLRRRELLDRYGIYAQLSVLMPVVIFQLIRLARWVAAERQRGRLDYSALPSPGVPSSPMRKKARESFPGFLRRRWRTFIWWLGGEFVVGWGQRGFWLGALLWTFWLLFLSVCQTGHDYLHLTKRFGIIAASQMPTHYMLSMKSPYSPFALAYGSSHERMNAFHRTSGRIIYTFLLLHAAFYLNFFVQAGVLQKRLTSLVPLLGIFAFVALSVLLSTSLSWVRHWSYRVFFVTHLALAVCILPVLFFHAPPLRTYVIECIVLFVLDLIARKLDTVTSFSKISAVPHTKLVKLTIPIPTSKASRFHAAAGQHVYLSVPRESRPSGTLPLSLYEILFNPFSVAEVSDSDITIVLRALHGPVTTALARLTSLSKANPPVSIEGPYGEARSFPNLAVDFDRVLLVAGGVGATFILPIYKSMATAMAADAQTPNRVTLIWAMRSIEEVRWVEKEGAGLVGVEEHIKVFLTGELNDLDASFTPPEDGSVEMKDIDIHAERSREVSGGHARPDLRKIVDETFQAGSEERVAVLVCGPPGMARELRSHVGRWVAKGRSVWFHDEAFGW